MSLEETKICPEILKQCYGQSLTQEGKSESVVRNRQGNDVEQMC